jgi:RNA polymerase sigma factor (TIGR02999 family)
MSDSSQSEITRILVRLQSGEIDPRAAADHLFELVYGELHRLASYLMRRERTDHTLQPTALVHEAYLRLVDASSIEWQSRAHFFGIAARAMRQVLVEHARRRAAAKREGGWERVTVDQALDLRASSDIKILRLEEVLTQLGEMDQRMARVVELRVFAGMRIKEVAHVVGVSPRTVDNDWSVARMWLTRELAEESAS